MDKENHLSIKEKLGNLFVSPENLIKEAEAYSNKEGLSPTEKETAYYYFLLKCFVAEHESCFGTIPLQVFNEHRMALDHFIRAKMTDKEEHDRKAIGHLCRALLDVVKLNCFGLRKDIEKRHSEIPKKAVGMVCDGEYIKGYIKKQNDAEQLLVCARAEDSKMGNDAHTDLEIINIFIHAYFAHKEWSRFQKENLGNILYIKFKYYTLVGLPLVIAFVIGLLTNVLSSYLLDLLK